MENAPALDDENSANDDLKFEFVTEPVESGPSRSEIVVETKESNVAKSVVEEVASKCALLASGSNQVKTENNEKFKQTTITSFFPKKSSEKEIFALKKTGKESLSSSVASVIPLNDESAAPSIADLTESPTKKTAVDEEKVENTHCVKQTNSSDDDDELLLSTKPTVRIKKSKQHQSSNGEDASVIERCHLRASSESCKHISCRKRTKSDSSKISTSCKIKKLDFDAVAKSAESKRPLTNNKTFFSRIRRRLRSNEDYSGDDDRRNVSDDDGGSSRRRRQAHQAAAATNSSSFFGKQKKRVSAAAKNENDTIMQQQQSGSGGLFDNLAAPHEETTLPFNQAINLINKYKNVQGNERIKSERRSLRSSKNERLCNVMYADDSALFVSTESSKHKQINKEDLRQQKSSSRDSKKKRINENGAEEEDFSSVLKKPQLRKSIIADRRRNERPESSERSLKRKVEGEESSMQKRRKSDETKRNEISPSSTQKTSSKRSKQAEDENAKDDESRKYNMRSKSGHESANACLDRNSDLVALRRRHSEANPAKVSVRRSTRLRNLVAELEITAAANTPETSEYARRILRSSDTRSTDDSSSKQGISKRSESLTKSTSTEQKKESSTDKQKSESRLTRSKKKESNVVMAVRKSTVGAIKKTPKATGELSRRSSARKKSTASSAASSKRSPPSSSSQSSTKKLSKRPSSTVKAKKLPATRNKKK